MASNHTVVYVEASQEAVGDPMELKLLNFTQSQIVVESNDPSILFSFDGPRASGAVLQRFDFESSLQRMSVVVKDKRGELHLYTKGSPEMMLGIMDRKSVPPEYN
jgi:magnesium-transporting ATPase (P-type)